MKEIWKDIEGYDGDYQISNFGNVVSYKRNVPRTMKSTKDHRGYLRITLSKNNKKNRYKIHLLVYDYFGKGKRNGRIIQVDHDDENKLNNRIDNLQLLTNRQNTTKSIDKTKTSSKYIGVSWFKRDKIWRTQIQINKIQIHIGYFQNEYDAHLAYKEAKNNIRT